MPHRTDSIDAAYCYKRSGVVCLCVRLCVGHNRMPYKNGLTDRNAVRGPIFPFLSILIETRPFFSESERVAVVNILLRATLSGRSESAAPAGTC